MAMQNTLDVPDQLGRKLQLFKDRLPEILEQGMRVVSTEEDSPSYGEREIMALLARQPTPEQVLTMRPSSALQQRVSELLQRNKEGELLRVLPASARRIIVGV